MATSYLKVAIVVILAAASANAHRIASATEGIVTDITGSSFTITTSSGKKVETELDPKATLGRSGQTIPKSEIRIGDRVIVHARLMERKLVADAVQVKATTRETARR